MICNGGEALDDDCDGRIGEDDPDVDALTRIAFGPDGDGDGFGTSREILFVCQGRGGSTGSTGGAIELSGMKSWTSPARGATGGTTGARARTRRARGRSAGTATRFRLWQRVRQPAHAQPLRDGNRPERCGRWRRWTSPPHGDAHAGRQILVAPLSDRLVQAGLDGQ